MSGNPRVLLISANREPFPEAVFPIGAVYVANALQKAGCGVRIFDVRHHSGPASLRQEILNFGADRIGISLRNIDNAAYPATRFYLPFYAELVKSIRAACDTPVILGGSAFSLYPDELLDHLAADGGIRGAGEGAAAAFQELSGGRIASADLPDMKSVAFPGNIRDIFPGFLRYRTIGVQTSRGCPNNCIYCTYPSLEGGRRMTRDAEGVAEEMTMLHRDFGIRNFFIVDSLFNANEDHMIRVLEGLRRRNLPIRFSCYMQPRISDPGICRLLSEAGCVGVDFGTDSGASSVLTSFRKPFTREDIRAASLACRKARIDVCHSLIFGGPGETARTIDETVRLMDELSPKAVIAMTGVRVYPGTGLEQIAVREGVVRAGRSLLEPQFYFSALGAGQLLKIVYGAVGRRRNWFFPGSKDWSATIEYRILHFFHRKGPLWRTFKQ